MKVEKGCLLRGRRRRVRTRTDVQRREPLSSIEDQLTTIDCFIDDFLCLIDDVLKAHPSLATWRRSPNGEPAFTDTEVLTIGLMPGSLGVAPLKETYQVIANNYRGAFPHLCSYGQWR